MTKALTDLTEQYNVTTPLHETVAEITARVYEELEVLHALDEPTSMTAIQQDLNRTVTEIQAIVHRHEEKDAVSVTDGTVERHSTTI